MGRIFEKTRQQIKAQIKARAWGAVSNTALKLYYVAPREMFQEEMLTLHRYALKRAYTALNPHGIDYQPSELDQA